MPQNNFKSEEFPFDSYWNIHYPNISTRVNKILEKTQTLHKKYKYFPVKEISEMIFGFSSKKTNQLVMSKIFVGEKFNYYLIHKIMILSAELKLNRDLVFEAVEKTEWKTSFNEGFDFPQSLVKKLLKVYNEKRVIKLLFSGQEYFLEDINRMFAILESKEFDKWDYFPKKPKSLKEIHDKMTSIITKMGQTDYDLEQREDVLNLDNKKILDGSMVIRVPKTHFDLIDLGESLNFCIGNGYYSQDVKMKRSSIVSVFDKDGPLYGIQFTRYAIRNAYGFGNKVLPEKVLFALEDCLISKPELPTDFIRMSHSFIYGYKYDSGSNFYVMFKNGGIYLYEGMTQETYEGFLSADSKGSYFARIIKPHHFCHQIS